MYTPAYDDTPFYLLHGYDANQAMDVEYGRSEKIVCDIGTYGLDLTTECRGPTKRHMSY